MLVIHPLLVDELPTPGEGRPELWLGLQDFFISFSIHFFLLAFFLRLVFIPSFLQLPCASFEICSFFSVPGSTLFSLRNANELHSILIIHTTYPFLQQIEFQVLLICYSYTFCSRL